MSAQRCEQKGRKRGSTGWPQRTHLAALTRTPDGFSAPEFSSSRMRQEWDGARSASSGGKLGARARKVHARDQANLAFDLVLGLGQGRPQPPLEDCDHVGRRG